MLRILKGIDRAIVATALGAAMILLALMSCVTFYQVITRFVLSSPSQWSEVAARSMMVWMVYLGLVAALRYGALISIDLVLDLVPDRLRKLVILASGAVSLSVLCVMIWYGWQMANRTWRQSLAGLVEPITGASIPIGLVYAAIPVGAALSLVALFARMAEELTEKARPSDLRAEV